MVLLAGGANPLRLDSHGWTPRALAAECAQRRPGAAHAAAFKSIDAVLKQAEVGLALLSGYGALLVSLALPVARA